MANQCRDYCILIFLYCSIFKKSLIWEISFSATNLCPSLPGCKSYGGIHPCVFIYTAVFNDSEKELYRQMMTVFNANSPTYHILLLDKPTLVWNFGSLAIAVQMLFSLSLTDDKTPIRLCKHCAKAFIPSRPNALFCSSKCKNQYNVYKSRAKEQ